MGLDMYMDRAKRIKEMSLQEMLSTVQYIDYLERPEEYKDTTFKEWCGGNIDTVRQDKVDEIKNNMTLRYSAWDTEKKYGHNGIWDGVAYWRKANAIHRWFINNIADGVDNCEPFEVYNRNEERSRAQKALADRA